MSHDVMSGKEHTLSKRLKSLSSLLRPVDDITNAQALPYLQHKRSSYDGRNAIAGQSTG